MAKKLSKKKKEVTKKVNKHLFLGGNYGMGNTMLLNYGVFVFERLKECQKIGSSIKKNNRTYEQERLIFANPETVAIMIKHLSEIHENMLTEQNSSPEINEIRIDFSKHLW